MLIRHFRQRNAISAVWEFSGRWPWRARADRNLFRQVAALMQSRTKTYMDAQAWQYFFTEDFAIDSKAQGKFLKDDTVKTALKDLAGKFAGMTDFTAAEIEKTIRAVEESYGIAQGKLNQPLRIAVTGIPVGAGVYETAEILGKAACADRIGRTLEKCV